MPTDTSNYVRLKVDAFILPHPKLTYEERRGDYDPGPSGAWNLANVGQYAPPAPHIPPSCVRT